jgi:aminopeptidase YwaD
VAEQIKFIEKTLKELCVNIGERPLGSRNNQKAQEYIGSVFQNHGYEVEFQGFDCMDWKGHDISLCVGDQSVPAVISPYSLPCDVKAEAVLVGSIDELEACDINGKVAVLYGDLTKEAIMPKNFKFWNPEDHQKIVHLLESKGPAALVTISFHEDQATPIFEDGDFDIPTAVVSKKYGELLLSSPGLISLKIVSERHPSTGANVIARRLGKAGGKKIVFTAHLDTKPGTPGALDNASGTASILTLSLLLEESHPFDFDLEFVAFNGEDYYSNAGEIAYLEAYSHEFQNILLNINCDGVGLRNSQIGISYMECPDSVVSLCEQTRSNLDRIEVIDPWYQGDHMLFVMKQVPALAVTSPDAIPLVDTVIHTEKDTIDLIDPTSILQTAEFLAQVVEGYPSPLPA